MGKNFRPMQMTDLEQVMAIEKVSFPTPWSREAYEAELFNQLACYIVSEHDGVVTGYAGAWCILDEAHITNVAVHPEWRGQVLGEELLRTLEQMVFLRGARRITLEVRPSNTPALRLYRRLGFLPVGLRKQYYADSNEDAIVMAKPIF
ncbi:MAG: ribosomal protein S18-alanine N-acetyltransferase [Syntrophomonadaceae bacterium]|nr:ribosomal protein S18-alanine N-acetyltransferase [Syntrophomonadaceae bacterium]